MKHGKRIAALAGLVVVLLSVLAFKAVGAKAAPSAKTIGANQPSSASCTPWSVVPSPHPSANSGLSDVAVISSKDIWAVGGGGSQIFGGFPLFEHWNGSRWQLVYGPYVRSRYSTLHSITAIAANNVWAAGYWVNSQDATQTLIEYWNGVQWSIVFSPNPGTENNEFLGIKAVAANDIWAVGLTSTASLQHTLIEHWNGARWSVVASPNTGSNSDYLSSITAISADHVWAVGARNIFSATLIEQWNGSHWTIVASPSLGASSDLRAVTALSASNAWAVGYDLQGNAIRTLVEHWNGTRWQIAASPNVGYAPAFWGVTAASANDIWAVGSDTNSSNNVIQTLIAHWNGTRWNVVPSPSPGNISTQLEGAATTSSGDVWAVGYADNHPLIEHAHCA